MAIDANVLAKLKERYEDTTDVTFQVDDVVAPLFFSCEQESTKNEGFGRLIRIPTDYGVGSAASADASISDTIAGDGAGGSTPQSTSWEVTGVFYDASYQVTREDLEACQGPGDQFNLLADRIEKAITRVRNRCAWWVHGDGNGAIAQISAITSSTITLPKWALNRIKVGDRLEAATAPSGGTFYTNPLRITAIATGTGVVTLSGDPTSTWANNPALYVFHDGDRGGVIKGTGAWVDSAGTSLFNVTRAGVPELSGYVITASGDTVDALTDIADTAFKNGLKQDVMYVNGTTWKILQREKDLQRQMITVGNSKYEIGVQSIMLATMWGAIPVVADAFLPDGECISGPFKTKEFRPRLIHGGKSLVRVEDIDGLEARRGTTAGDRTYKGNVMMHAQLVMTPGKFVRGVSLPTS